MTKSALSDIIFGSSDKNQSNAGEEEDVDDVGFIPVKGSKKNGAKMTQNGKINNTNGEELTTNGIDMAVVTENEEKPNTNLNDSSSVNTDNTSNKIPTGNQVHEHWIEMKVNGAKTKEDGISKGLSVLTQLQSTFGGDVIIYGTNDKPIPDLQTKPFKSMIECCQYFEIHSPKKPCQVIIFKVATTIGFSAIKRDPSIFSVLIQKNIFLRKHHFKPTTWDVSPIGWMAQVHTQCDAKEFITEAITKSATAQKIPHSQIPEFAIVQTVATSQYDKNQKISTRCWQIQCARSDQKMLLRLLQRAENNLPFVPWRWKYMREMRAQFRKSILIQIEYLRNSMIIPVIGVSNEVLPYLANTVKSIAGVHQFTKAPNKTDRYNIITHAQIFNQTKTAATNCVNEIWNKIVPEGVKLRAKRPLRVGKEDEDDDQESMGNDSYDTACTKSIDSYTTIDESEIPDYQAACSYQPTTSYAEVLKGKVDTVNVQQAAEIEKLTHTISEMTEKMKQQEQKHQQEKEQWDQKYMQLLEEQNHKIEFLMKSVNEMQSHQATLPTNVDTTQGQTRDPWTPQSEPPTTRPNQQLTPMEQKLDAFQSNRDEMIRKTIHEQLAKKVNEMLSHQTTLPSNVSTIQSQTRGPSTPQSEPPAKRPNQQSTPMPMQQLTAFESKFREEYDTPPA